MRWGFKLHGRAHKYVLMLCVRYERVWSMRNLRKMAKTLILSACAEMAEAGICMLHVACCALRLVYGIWYLTFGMRHLASDTAIDTTGMT